MASKKIDFAAINRAALGQFESLLGEWLPDGETSGSEYRAINPTRGDSKKGSFSINIRKGVWQDFATDDAGSDPISLFAYLFHNNDQGAAAKELAAELGVDLPNTTRKTGADSSRTHRQPRQGDKPAEGAQSHSKKSTSDSKPGNDSPWHPIIPVPADAPERHKAHSVRGLPDTVWTYHGLDGAVLGHVYRFKSSDGGKEVLPLTWCQHEKSGKTEWRWMQWAVPRPLYGLDRLTIADIDAPEHHATVLLVGLLKTERSTWWMQWKELSQFILPYNGRFFNSDRDKGWKRFNAIYDNSATRANRILAAGMMSGASSPSRPWFKLSLHDKDLMRFHPVKDWLATVTDLIAQALVNSNTYRVLPMLYGEMGVFGTASALIADDYKNVIHLHPFTVGEYCIETDWKGDVVTIYREFDKTVGAIVSEFGYDNCSKTLQNQFDRGQLDIWYTVRHAVEPRSDRDPNMIDAKNMAWRSVYWEMSKADGHLLRESGYKSFPCVCPRWQVMGGDIYGNSPGMETLGDVKQLQAQQFRKSQAIDYQANPPLQVPSDMKNRELEIFPGGISYYDTVLTGAIHAHDCFTVIRYGEMMIYTEDGVQHVKAGDMVPSKAGIKRAGFAIQDTYLTGFMANPTNETDLDKIWDFYTVPNESLMDASITEMLEDK